MNYFVEHGESEEAPSSAEDSDGIHDECVGSETVSSKKHATQR
mgnify:CR=1 FL=1